MTTAPAANVADPGLPVLPEAKMHLHTVVEPCTGTVVSNERCTASKKAAGFVRHISIDVGGTQLAGNFRPGQSFGVVPPGLDPNGNNHKLRLYSLASPTRGEDGKGSIVATTVKRVIDEHWESHKLFLGVASNYLCDLKVGDKVTLTGPAGKRFLLPAEPSRHNYLFIATGTGIAPFRGMILDLLEGSPAVLNSPALPPARSDVTFLMGSPYASDFLYHKELGELARSHENFKYWTALSRERQCADVGDPTLVNAKPMYVQDRLSAIQGQLEKVLDDGKTLVYVCGIAGMELGIFQTMARTLPPDLLRKYIEVDPEAMTRIDSWDRKMIHKQIKPTKRMFLEVY